MEGGAETGFRHVEPTKYKTRLLQVFGKGANLTIREVNQINILRLLLSLVNTYLMPESFKWFRS